MQNFLLAQVTAINTSNHWVKVKFLEYDNKVTKDYIPIMYPPTGESKEGNSGPLAIDDLVVIAFFDKECQNPFVMGKIRSSAEYISGKKIRFHEHEVEFTADEVTITHKEGDQIKIENGTITAEQKNGSKIVLENNKITLQNSTSLTSIKYNDLDLVAWLQTLLGPPSTILGNLGYPVTETVQIAELVAAIGKASSVKKVTFE